jgi:hypothetical protein
MAAGGASELKGRLCPAVELPTRPKSRSEWATLYNRVGGVKRHVEHSKVLTFAFVEVFGFGVAFAHATKARLQNLPVEFLVPPTIYSVT